MRLSIACVAVLVACSNPNGGAEEYLCPQVGALVLTGIADGVGTIAGSERCKLTATVGELRVTTVGETTTVEGADRVEIGDNATVAFGPDAAIDLEGDILTTGTGDAEVTTRSGGLKLIHLGLGAELSTPSTEATGPLDYAVNDAGSAILRGLGPDATLRSESSVDDAWGFGFHSRGEVEWRPGFEPDFACLQPGATASMSTIFGDGAAKRHWSCAGLADLSPHAYVGSLRWSLTHEDAPDWSMSLDNGQVVIEDDMPVAMEQAFADSRLQVLRDDSLYLDVTGPVLYEMLDQVLISAQASESGRLSWHPLPEAIIELPPQTTWDRLPQGGLAVSSGSDEALLVSSAAEALTLVSIASQGLIQFSGQAEVLDVVTADAIQALATEVDGGLSLSADPLFPLTWTAHPSGSFATLRLTPRGIVDLMVVLPAGAYTFDCAGPCPELPAGVIDGEGPLVEVVPEVGWSGALELTLSP